MGWRWWWWRGGGEEREEGVIRLSPSVHVRERERWPRDKVLDSCLVCRVGFRTGWSNCDKSAEDGLLCIEFTTSFLPSFRVWATEWVGKGRGGLMRVRVGEVVVEGEVGRGK